MNTATAKQSFERAKKLGLMEPLWVAGKHQIPHSSDPQLVFDIYGNL